MILLIWNARTLKQILLTVCLTFMESSAPQEKSLFCVSALFFKEADLDALELDLLLDLVLITLRKETKRFSSHDGEIGEGHILAGLQSAKDLQGLEVELGLGSLLYRLSEDRIHTRQGSLVRVLNF